MSDYDISEAFAHIEGELISSMFRNFSRHRAEETKEGFNWEMWQVRQLNALEEYRKANKKRFTKEFSDLNKRIDEFIRQSRTDGAAQQEIAILEAMKRGYTPKNAFTGTAELAADFIKLNNRKMDALINATTNDLKRAEHAMLRMADDQYRKIIFNAQVYAASGAGTYEKAVDMAARDFLKAGINCIEYKNGARHTIQDYVSMVMTTTGKRAYLTGEGEMRKQWGESLVIMNKRGNPCPLCAPFVGKVLIDDVWSGGKPDGIHMLMSNAIEKGLYHPRCKDGHTTYFEGVSDEGEPYTESERRDLAEQYNAEQKSNYAKNQAEKFGRISMYSLDEENKRVYASRAEKWERIAGKIVDNFGGSGIIELNRKLDRKEVNTGAFEKLEVPMQKRSVLAICKKYSIDTKGITFKIQRSEKMLALPFYGSTDYNNIGRIDLFPNAFSSEEELTKTIIHEKCHVKQLKKYGKKYVQDNLDQMEKQAYRFESIYYNILKKGGNSK